MPADLMFGSPTEEQEPLPDPYLKNLKENIVKSHEIARKTLQTKQKRMKKDYDVKIWKKSYDIGDCVYILDTACLKGKNKKLSPYWKGPGVIDKVLTPYLLRVKTRNAQSIMHHDRIKPCRDREIPPWVEHYRNKIMSGDHSTPVRPTRKIYCVCRRPWGKGFGIQCDYCLEWFHGRCVNLTPEEAECIDIYTCPYCDSSQPA
ncbi:hypothetical protein SNE40_009733 [Patella caerulea]